MYGYLSFLCTPDLEIYYAYTLDSHADIRDVYGDIPNAAECEWTKNLPGHLTVKHDSKVIAANIKEKLTQKCKTRANFIEEFIKSFKIEGEEFYYKNGKSHREDKPAIISSNGYEAYYQKGKRHRIDGPAVIWPDGTRKYYFHGNLHRTDGPAIVWANGIKEYYLNGKHLSLVGFYWKLFYNKRTSLTKFFWR